MKPVYKRRSWSQLPAHVQAAFLKHWQGADRPRGWMRFVSGDYGFIMNRKDEWYAAKYG